MGSANQFPMPVVLPNGDVILTDYTGAGVVYRRSTDGGHTFGGPADHLLDHQPALPSR